MQADRNVQPEPAHTKFCTRSADSVGLDYYRARYYSPVLGRFISEDPMAFGGGGGVGW
ncbi:RHS repeat-associated core domain-containing protein, partial [Dyella ginsengisoli]|uniref:RHS repeat-associated core domain-containing protein n=1 Tax=Dyella ginsengisoli TaxID=363848 RepID=UPI003D2F80F1